MPTFNKHGEIDGQDDELQQMLREKEIGAIGEIPKKQVHRPAPGVRPQRMFPPMLIGVGVAALLLLVMIGVGVGVAIGRSGTPAIASTQIAAPTNAAVTVATAALLAPEAEAAAVPPAALPATEATVSPTAESAVLLVPTAASADTPVDTEAMMAIRYTDGISAYTRQDWGRAAELFQSIYSENEQYLDISEKLSATYYNWGMSLLDPSQPAEALDKFNATLSISPTHQLALDQQQRLVLYLDALTARDGGDLREAAIKLEELRDIQSDYLDSATMLYDTYMAYGADLESQKKLSDALRIYQKAAALPVEDTSVAKAKVKALTPTATPRPAAAATPRPAAAARLRFSVLNYNDNPSCISIRITGIGTGGWYFTVDGVGGVVGRFDTGGNARACGLSGGQEVTLTIHYPDGGGVPGGTGVPSRGSAIMSAPWK